MNAGVTSARTGVKSATTSGGYWTISAGSPAIAKTCGVTFGTPTRDGATATFVRTDAKSAMTSAGCATTSGVCRVTATISAAICAIATPIPVGGTATSGKTAARFAVTSVSSGTMNGDWPATA